MKVWITKYALSMGIYEREAKEPPDRGHVVAIEPEAPNGWTMYHHADWWKSRKDALARAEYMRTSRIASLEKQIAKLRKMRFT